MRPAAYAVLILATSLCASVPVFADDLKPEDVEFFETRIRPVLVKHCYECHSETGGKQRGNFSLEDSAGLLKGGDSGTPITAGKPEASLLIGALKYEDIEMPPKGKLPDAVIKDFETWVKMGAPDPRVTKAPAGTPATTQPTSIASHHWAFQKPVKPDVPAVDDATWAQDPIDHFVLARLAAHKLSPAPAADRRTLIRRAYFDLIGLPPAPEQVDAFLADAAPDKEAFAKVVDELLRSPHYGERWGRYWLDIARYAEDQAHTFKARNYPQGYLYRDWVVKAFNDDLPYDQFITQQIAADLLQQPDQHEQLAALGLFALGPVYYQDNGEKDKALADEIDDRIDTLIRGTQALTLSCARCHDHKFDPLTMADYYGLVGVFASSEYQERPAVPDDVVRARRDADAAAQASQLEIDRFLAAQSRGVREALVPSIPEYLQAAAQVLSRRKAEKDLKKSIERVAKNKKLNEELLRRWVAYLEPKQSLGVIPAERPYLANWNTFRDAGTEGDNDGRANEALKVGQELLAHVTTLLPRRAALTRQFGEDVAFLAEADRADVAPGVIPLGNLFDDAPDTPLASAVVSDPFKSKATENSLGVVRVAQGWGHQTSIAPGINFEFRALGSDERAHGAIVNDGWDEAGGLRTTGERGPSNLPRTEQGIGMHANALITFDLDVLRRAGLIPVDRPFTLRVDRAGYNDDAQGGGQTGHVAVIVSKPHHSPSEFDAVLLAMVDGVPADIKENDGVYYVNGQVPPPIKANGQFVSFDIKLPLEARYVTLVSTGAAQAGEENSISSDHLVFSGARLEYEPNTPAAGADVSTDAAATSGPEARVDALLLSELFADKGLLAVPAKDVGQFLSGEPAEKLKALEGEQKKLKQAADAIQVVMAHALGEGASADAVIYLAGDPRKKGPPAPRAFPAILTGGQSQPFASSGSGRLELARAITSRDNPLTARVMANRVWAGHFGVGLVRTPSNFGVMGEKPSHPELLDWLAFRLMDSGWSLKSLHREIMLSATYRQSSTGDSAEADPENRWLGRMNRRRLEVEPWRDAMLSVSGQLKTSIGGPSRDLGAGDNHRRTIYGFVSRHRLDELLRLFDFPDPNITAGQRTVTTVPLQQLFVLNSGFVAEQARRLVARTQKEGGDDTARLTRMYALLYSRPPTEAEQTIALEFLASAPTDNESKLSLWEQLALALLGANEFSFVD